MALGHGGSPWVRPPTECRSGRSGGSLPEPAGRLRTLQVTFFAAWGKDEQRHRRIPARRSAGVDGALPGGGRSGVRGDLRALGPFRARLPAHDHPAGGGRGGLGAEHVSSDPPLAPELSPGGAGAAVDLLDRPPCRADGAPILRPAGAPGGAAVRRAARGPGAGAGRRDARPDRSGRALGTLAEAGREAVWLHHVEGFSFREIAAVQGISETAAKVRAHRAIVALRGEFEGGRRMSATPDSGRESPSPRRSARRSSGISRR